jgi:hypothetical protein
MNINEISFDCFRKQLIESFKLKHDLGSFMLNPDGLCKVFEISEKTLELVSIPDWEEFECGTKDISYEDFIKLLFKENYRRNGTLYVITDECFKNKVAYAIDFFDLEEFIMVEYFGLHQMCFFQPEDIIFFSPNEKILSILHHSGVIGYFSEE